MGWKFRSKLLTCSLFIFSLNTCSDDNIYNSETAIVGGHAPSTNHPANYSAVSVISNLKDTSGNISSSNRCTGTIVASNLIVTAAHCFDPFDDGKLRSPSDINIIFTKDMNQNVSEFYTRKGKQYLVHPEYNEFYSYGDDIAWIKFDGGLPTGYRPIGIFPPEKISNAAPMEFSGFGIYDENGSEGGQLRAVATKFNTMILNNPIARGMFATSGTRGKNACHGDSGGPSYYFTENEWFVVGAISGEDIVVTNTDSCDSGNAINTSIAFFAKSWIEPTSGVSLNVKYPEVVTSQPPMSLLYSESGLLEVNDSEVESSYIEFGFNERKKISKAYLDITYDHQRSSDILIKLTFSDGQIQNIRTATNLPRKAKQRHEIKWLEGKFTNEIVGIDIIDNVAGISGAVASIDYSLLILK